MSQDGPENLPAYSVKSFCWVSEDSREVCSAQCTFLKTCTFFALFVAAISIIKAGMKDQNTVVIVEVWLCGNLASTTNG